MSKAYTDYIITHKSNVEKAYNWLKENKKDHHYLISVDGGINDITCNYVKEAGADVIVVGSYLTKEKIEKEKVLNLMK